MRRMMADGFRTQVKQFGDIDVVYVIPQGSQLMPVIQPSALAISKGSGISDHSASSIPFIRRSGSIRRSSNTLSPSLSLNGNDRFPPNRRQSSNVR